ncbi:type II secretion system protein [Desulfobaculum sp. SPO524]|uniref:type II secretion system protein n=1 Tax=Desulfobaculum sp. SPO524 TaxID=3378071 RepID=UPI00385457E2
MNLNTRKKNGFTMIELIAVIVILGILAAAAVPRFLDARDDARTASASALKANWMSVCSIASARSALSGNDFECPGDPTAESGADTTWNLEKGTFNVVIGGTTGTESDPCTITISEGGLSGTVTGQYIHVADPVESGDDD